MPAQDFVAHVKRLIRIRDSALRCLLLGDHAQWGPDEENRALLLEVEAYRLQLDWTDRTTDPEDPEVRRDRLDAKRKGLKPPKRPVVPPVAQRPGELAQERLQHYIDELVSHEPKPAKEIVALDEFDRVIAQM